MKKRIAATLLLLAMLFGVMAPFTALQEIAWAEEIEAPRPIEIVALSNDLLICYDNKNKNYVSSVIKIELSRKGKTFSFTEKKTDSGDLNPETDFLTGEHFYYKQHIRIKLTEETRFKEGDTLKITSAGYQTRTFLLGKKDALNGFAFEDVPEQPPASKVTKVSITNAPGEIEKGKELTLQATVEGENLTEEQKSVAWSLEGNQKDGTKIDRGSGTLTIAKDESAEKITVTATSNSDNKIKGMVEIGITKETPQKVTVSFNPGEGTGSMDAVKVEKDADYELPSCTFIAPKGKEFDGWKVGEEIKKVGETITVSEAITITAQWKEKESQELKEPIMPAENAFTADESSYSIGYKKNDEIKSYLEKVTAVKVMKKDGTIKEYKKDATGGIIVSPNTVQPNITFLDKDLDLSVEDKVEIIAEGYKSLNLTITEKVSYYGFIFSFKKTNESFEEVEAAKAKLKTYVESIVWDVLEGMPGIKTTSNQAAIEEFQAHYEQAGKLLKKENAKITPEELNSMKKMPSYKEGDKKIKGTFSEIVKKMRADFKVVGARTEKNKDNEKTYPVLNQGKIQIQSQIPNLTNAKDAKQRLYLNYITQGDYEEKNKTDATGGATPKYKKQEVPVDDYTVTYEDNDVYTITVKKIPEGAVILKPVVKVYLANITFVENGDMVYVKKSVTPTPSVPYTPSVPSTPAPKMPTKLEDTEQGKRYTAEGTPEALNGAVKLDVVIDEQGRTHWNFLDKDGNKVKTKGAVKVTMPMKEGLRAPYRIKVNGVYTTFEEQNGSFSTVLRPMADVEMVRLNDTVDGRQGILEGTKEALNGAVSMKLEKKSNGAFVFRLYDAQGKEVKSNGYVFVELPVPTGTKAPYRLSVGGVKTTFEETNHGTLAFALSIQ